MKIESCEFIFYFDAGFFFFVFFLFCFVLFFFPQSWLYIFPMQGFHRKQEVARHPKDISHDLMNKYTVSRF